LKSNEALRVLVVDSDELQARALSLLPSARDLTAVKGPGAAARALQERPYDIALVAVGTSLLHSMGIAAGLRAVERELRPLRRHVTVIACTLNSDDYKDSLVAVTGLSGALNSPWTLEAVHACLNHWRAGKYLPALLPSDGGAAPRGDPRPAGARSALSAGY
jgi:CheY-like chemotaxis protein